MSVKIERIAENIQRELANIMLLEARDETLKHITITDCEVTSDLSFATIYYTYMGNEDIDDVKLNLEEAKGYLRTKLARSIELRHTPELRFVYDTSIEYGQNIERIINDLHKNDKEESAN